MTWKIKLDSDKCPYRVDVDNVARCIHLDSIKQYIMNIGELDKCTDYNCPVYIKL